jgi:phospholipase/carboxylesterase
MKPLDTETIELLSAAVPRPLFVLLHDAGGTAADMLGLGQRLRDAFADAAILIPERLSGSHCAGMGEDPHALAARVAALAAFVRAQQQRFALPQSDSALAGLGAGASLALAFSDAHDGLVGRVLAFGGSYPVWPVKAPRLTTLHLLHGQNDKVVPIRQAREGFKRLTALGADATLDVAASLGHALHPVLMDQAVTRLQTCVPLRHWPVA